MCDANLKTSKFWNVHLIGCLKFVRKLNRSSVIELHILSHSEHGFQERGLFNVFWGTGQAKLFKDCSLTIYIEIYTEKYMYTLNSKKVVFWIVALCIAHCGISRPQSTMGVANLYIVACQDHKGLCSTLLPWLVHECRCLIVDTCNAI